MDLAIFERLESEVRGYIRSFPTLFAKAQGATLHDVEGRQYVDFFSGAGTLNYGHNNPLIKKRLMEYLASDGVVHGLDMATVAKKEFLETFEQVILQPRKMQYKVQFTGPTGTNAVEAALKLARQVKNRTNIVSFTNGFHGVTGGALAATGQSKFRQAAGIALGNTAFMPYDGYLGSQIDTIELLERMITDASSGLDLPAAVIVETVQGEGGVNVASVRWLRALEALCHRHDVLLIVDDIQAGCGRTGTYFSFEHAGISPDIITLSKSLSGYGLPMSIVLMKPKLDVWSPGAHSGTFRGNNLAFVTAREALIRYWSTPAFQDELRPKMETVKSQLEHIVAQCPRGSCTVRGRGMIWGLAMADPESAGKITARAFEKGLVIETSGAVGQVVKLLPPLTIDEATLRQGLKILEECVLDVLGATSAQSNSIRFLRRAGAR